MQAPVNQGENIRSLAAKVDTTAAAQAIIQRDAAAFYHQTLSSPVFNTVTKAVGAYIYDGAGKAYLDLHGNGVHTVGYNNPFLLEAMKKQMEAGLTFAPRRFTNEPAVLLAEKLISVAPEGFKRVLFCPGGSEAIEMAVMLAKHYTGKWKTLSYYGSFHGAGFQAVSIGADPHFRNGIGPSMPGALHLELPDYYRNPWGYTDVQQIDDEYIRQLKVQIAFNPDIAALIAEPIFYNSTVPSVYFWQHVKSICTENDILLIFDEIYTAFGRTGKMFAAEHFVEPDIIVVGKGFGGGILPFAGIIGKEALNTIDHTSIGHYTHEKNPLCCAVAVAMITFVENEQLVSKAATLGEYFRKGLEELKATYEQVGNISGLGLNLAVDIVTDRQSKTRATEAAQLVMAYCMQHGLSLKLIQGNILNLKPALTIEPSEINFVLQTLKDAFVHIGLQ